MSVSSTNLSGNNVTAFNRYRRLAAERARAEAEAKKAKKPEILEPPIAEPSKPIALSMEWTKVRLMAIAKEQGVDVNEDMTKAQIIAAIKGGE